MPPATTNPAPLIAHVNATSPELGLDAPPSAALSLLSVPRRGMRRLVVARDERLLDPGEWEELAQAGIRLGQPELREASAELTGTTETRLQIEWVDSVLEWSWSSGAQLEGDESSRVAGFVQRLEKLLPELHELLQTPYPN